MPNGNYTLLNNHEADVVASLPLRGTMLLLGEIEILHGLTFASDATSTRPEEAI